MAKYLDALRIIIYLWSIDNKIMRINRLKLNNFRGFKNLDIYFNSRLNVFCGINGSGKTTLLDAISMIMNHGIHRLTNPNEHKGYYPEHWLTADDINSLSQSCEVEISYSINNSELKYKLRKGLWQNGFNYEGDEFEKFFNQLRNDLTDKTDLPVVTYYNSTKNYELPLGISEKNNIIKRYPQLNAYVNASNKNIFSFSDFSKWWRENEDIENEIRLRENQDFRFRELNIVRDAILSFFNLLGPDAYTDLSVLRAKPKIDKSFNFEINDGGELFIKKNGDYIKIAQLSDGEKNLLLIVADLASRIAQLTPSSEYPLSSAKGIVLIDEMELHLHPSWQRKVIAALLNTFLSLQFFVTTHSEIVMLTILDAIKNVELNNNDVKIYFLSTHNGELTADDQNLNKFGQLKDGLSNFYLDLLTEQSTPFTL